MTLVRINGWFYCPEKKKGDKDVGRIIEMPPKFDTIMLNTEQFKYSCREFDVESLEIVPMRRYVGNLFNMKEVQAVVNVKGSLIPFFVERRKVVELEKLISKENNPIARL